jgi:hypothetical protein
VNHHSENEHSRDEFPEHWRLAEQLDKVTRRLARLVPASLTLYPRGSKCLPEETLN